MMMIMLMYKRLRLMPLHSHGKYRISKDTIFVVCHFCLFSSHAYVCSLSVCNLFVYHSVGFGLIAFNFLVLGNMGDMGVGGVIARIMNTFG